MGTQRADYVAQWFAGEYEEQTAAAANNEGSYLKDNGPAGTPLDTNFKAYGLTFDQWVRSRDFTYSSEFPFAYETPFTPHWANGFSGYHWIGPYGIPDLNGKILDLY